MEVLEHYLSLLTKAIFIENILLAYFLGMCSFLSISKNVNASIGLGIAVIFTNTLTVPINWAIKNSLLNEGALAWIPISGFDMVNLLFLRFIMYIAIIAATVQLIEMILEKFSPKLSNSLGIFLPLIAVNCAILGASLLMNERGYTLSESLVFGFGSGVGWALAIVTMAAIRFRLKYSNIPKGLRGIGITMILTGLISMAYLSFSGINL